MVPLRVVITLVDYFMLVLLSAGHRCIDQITHIVGNGPSDFWYDIDGCYSVCPGEMPSFWHGLVGIYCKAAVRLIGGIEQNLKVFVCRATLLKP
jgi:hypothetical protein